MPITNLQQALQRANQLGIKPSGQPIPSKEELEIKEKQAGLATGETTAEGLSIDLSRASQLVDELSPTKEGTYGPLKTLRGTAPRGFSSAIGFGFNKFLAPIANILTPGKGTAILPGTPAFDYEAKSQQLVDILSVLERQKLKGQGTVSDFEGRMLASAVARLKTGSTEKGFIEGLKDTRSLITLKQGGRVPVTIDGVTGEANSSEIFDLEKQGYAIKLAR